MPDTTSRAPGHAKVTGRGTRRRRPPAGLLAASLLVGVAALLPVVYLLVRASQSGVGEALETLTEPRTRELLVRSALLVLAVTSASTALAIALAWLTARTDLPGRRAWSVLVALPMVVPSYVGGYAFVAALSPRGLLQQILEPLGVDRLPDIYGYPGAIGLLTLVTYPYVFLMVRAVLQSSDPGQEEAAMTLGHSRWRSFGALILPQLRPAIGAGALLCALYTLHDFGAVSLLRFDSFTNAIYLAYQGSFDRSRAAMLALVLIAMSSLVVMGERRFRKTPGAVLVTSGRKPLLLPLRRWRWPALALCSSVTLAGLGLPLVVIGYWLYRGMTSERGLVLGSLGLSESLQAAALGTVAALIAALPVALVSARYRARTSRAAEAASLVGHALPALVVGLALVFFGARYLPVIYQTRALLAFAYAILFLPLAGGAMRVALLRVSPRLEEAAGTLGRSRFQIFIGVTLPVIRPGIVAAAALVFLNAMKELPATLLLAPTGFSTLATRVWSATSAAVYDRAAPAALALILVSSVPLAFLLLREDRLSWTAASSDPKETRVTD